LTTTDTLTTKRLISREGVITRTGRDIPIDRVNAVNYERRLIDRIFGCGTLVVQTAGTESDVELHDVAHIERRLIQIQQILVDEQTEEDRRVRAIVREEQRGTADAGSPTTAPSAPLDRPADPEVAPVDEGPSSPVDEDLPTPVDDADSTTDDDTPTR